MRLNLLFFGGKFYLPCHTFQPVSQCKTAFVLNHKINIMLDKIIVNQIMSI